MASGKSTTQSNKILNAELNATAYSSPVTVYIALWTATLSASSTGATAGEVSGGSYARVAVTCNTTNFPSASGGSISNGTAINFPTPTAGWGTVTYVAILDSATLGAGNILYWGALTTSQTISSGNTVSFGIGALTVTEA